MDVIEKFLENYLVIKTRRSYRSALKLFFEVIQKEPNTYFKTKQDYEDDILKFWRHLNGRSPVTITTYIATIRMFFSDNDHELPSKFWRGIRNRTKGTRPITEDKIPSPQDLKLILSHADARGRALFTVLLQSGMRIGELAQIELDDIDYSTNPTKIRIRPEITKSGNQRYCFIGSEATSSLKSYLERRQKYLDASIGRSKALTKYYSVKPKSKDDPRVFPYDEGQIREIWNRLLGFAKLEDRDKRTQYHKMHPHTLRKYFRTHMSLSVPLDVVEALMGHEGYLTETYRRYTVEQLGEQYLKGEKDISVFETPVNLSGINESLKQKDKDIEEMKKQIAELRLTLLEEKVSNGRKH